MPGGLRLAVDLTVLGTLLSLGRRFLGEPLLRPVSVRQCAGLHDPRRPGKLPPWAGQFSTDYATGLNDLESVGGRLVLSTASRFGVEASARYFQERLPGDKHDALWLGDGNLVFCFARNEQMQWRTGLGLNWLSDPQQTDVGFNFTYGFDWFPRKPWVASAEIDWGNLGRSGLFHFRGTVGVLVNRFEAYTGYEYYDFDRVHSNALIGGVRVWLWQPRSRSSMGVLTSPGSGGIFLGVTVGDRHYGWPAS